MEHKITLDLDTLADVAVPRDLRISPDGTRVIYSLRPFTYKSEAATSALWIAEIGKEQSARQFTSGLFNDEDPKWSPDGTTIAFKSDRAKAGKSSAIYIMPLSGGEAFAITPIEHERFIPKFEWSPNGTCIAFTRADEKSDEEARKEKEKDDAKVWGEDWKFRRLRLLHLATKTLETIVGGNQHISDFSWSPDGKQLVYVDHGTPEIHSPMINGAKIHVFNTIKKGSNKVASFPGPLTNIEWGEHGVYFLAAVVPKSCATSNQLYKLSLEKRSWSSFGNFGVTDCCTKLQKSKSHLAVSAQASLEDVLYSLDHDKLTEGYRARQGISAFDVSKSHEKTQVAFIKSNSSNPDEVFSVDTKSTSIVRLSNHNSTLASLNISNARPIMAVASDGYDLDGVLFLPSKYKESDGPLPTVLYIHGGPYFRLTDSFSIHMHYEVPLLVSAGYAVLCPNYRGSSGRGQKHAGFARGKMGIFDYADCITMLNEAIQQSFVDASRVLVGGWSQGGFLSYLTVTRPDFQFRGAICGAGVSDWDSMAMSSDAYWFERDLAGGAPWDVDTKNGKKLVDGEEFDKPLPDGSKKWLKKTSGGHGSALWHMRNVKTPVLIFHGEADIRVPFFQGVAFYRACIHNNVPVTMVSYPREGHIFTERKHIIDMWKRILQFADLHLQ
ncbi:WD40-like Beta Propeller [Penicillium angulare]|uniref:Dipeptidyl-peptidase V n=1 Tax=Penicillium angulare TaxID=116970 RepID=A0A9W9FBX0_9EURO|nr:WD40-like Beta Propeller [Penicillium angulare]